MSEPSTLERNPLALRSAATAAVGAIVALLGIFFDWFTPEVSAAVIATGASVAALIVVFVRPDVTPVADPRDSDGNALIQVDPEEYEDYLDNELIIEVEDEEEPILGY